MINRDVFTHWIGVLADRFGRELKAPTLRVYYELLCEELDTNAFQVGCKLVLKREQFFPSPQQIIDAANPAHDRSLEALGAFRKIADGVYPHSDAIAREAMKLCGVWGTMGDMAPGVRAQKERQFLETYQAIAARQRAESELRTIESHIPTRPMLAAGAES